MFDRFTDHAKLLLNLTRIEAQRLHHAHIGIEHLLLGLAALEGGIAVRMLRVHGIDGTRLRAAVEARVAPGPADSAVTQLPFTPELKRVLERSMAEASRLGHRYIGTEHFLLALLGHEEGLAAEVLRALGVEIEDARRAIEELLDSVGEEDDPASAPAPESIHAIGDPSSKSEEQSRARDRAETEYRRSWPARALTPLPADWRPFAGRTHDLERLAASVERRARPCVVVGRPGVGKSALLGALARRMQRGRGDSQDATRFVRVEWAELARDARGTAEFERRIAHVFASARKLGDLTLVLDPIPMFDAKYAKAARAAYGALVRELERAEVPCIATATPERLDALTRAAPDFAACFEPLPLEPPTLEEARAIVAESAVELGPKWKVFFAPDALDAALELHERALPERVRPGAALELLETTAAFALEREFPEHPEVRALRDHVDELDLDRRLRPEPGAVRESHATRIAASHARSALEHLERSRRTARPILRITAADVRATVDSRTPPAGA